MPKKIDNILQTEAQKAASEFAPILFHRVNSARVKTASPSRAQKKIQVRITYESPNGKRGLGYYSMNVSVAEKLTKQSIFTNYPHPTSFINEVFRVTKWAESSYDSAARSQEIQHEMRRNGPYDIYDKAKQLLLESLEAIH